MSQVSGKIIVIYQDDRGWHGSGIMPGVDKSEHSLKNRVEGLEKVEIVRALKECNWVMARAAKMLGITERMIGYKIRKYAIRTKEVRFIEGLEDEHGSSQE